MGRTKTFSNTGSYLWKGSHIPSMLRWPTSDMSLTLGWTDKQLLDGYQRTSGTPGAPEVDLILKEIKRRNLDI